MKLEANFTSATVKQVSQQMTEEKLTPGVGWTQTSSVRGGRRFDTGKLTYTWLFFDGIVI